MFADVLVMHCLIAMQFSRTVAPDTSKGPALIAFMQHHNWRKITILSSTESIWLETRQDLVKQLEAASIKVLKPAAFEPGDVKVAMLSEIRRSGFRIVFVLSYYDDAKTLASLGHRESMTTGWAWLVSEERTAVPAMAGWLWFRSFLGSDMHTFAKQVSNYSKSHFDITVHPDSVDLGYSAALYDSIMLYAHAVAKVMSEGGDLRDGEVVTAALRNTTIEGVGGTAVALDSNGDRIESYEVMNYIVGTGNLMRSMVVGLIDATLNKYRPYEQAVIWPGNMMEVPVDYFSGEHWPFCVCFVQLPG